MASTYTNPQVYAQNYSVSKRLLTAQEAAASAALYKKFRNPLAFFSLFSILLGVILMSSTEGNIDMLSLMALVFGLISVAVAGASLSVRGKIAKALRTGDVTVVQGFATKMRTPARWTVGPISLRETPELRSMMREGPATVAYIPSLKAAMSVNGINLKKSAWVDGPADLAPTGSYPAPQVQMAPSQQVDDLPPPPDDLPSQGMFCPRCGSKNPAGARFCQNCSGEMPRL